MIQPTLDTSASGYLEAPNSTNRADGNRKQRGSRSLIDITLAGNHAGVNDDGTRARPGACLLLPEPLLV